MTMLDQIPQDEASAIAFDHADPLSRLRSQFSIPVDDEGEPVLYFCGNSLGLASKSR